MSPWPSATARSSSLKLLLVYLDLEAGQTTMGVGSYVQYFVRAIPDEIHAALAVLSVQATIIHAARVEEVFRYELIRH